jgi:WD40 repeat protein
MYLAPFFVFWKEIHENGITSVQFNPRDTTQVLTNSLDSTLKIVDLKTGTIVRVFRHAEFSSCHAWSSSVFSPDGRFVASGSSANGYIFIWNANDGILKAQLKDGHQKVPVVGIDWGRNSEQSVATIDRKGVLVFWS